MTIHVARSVFYVFCIFYNIDCQSASMLFNAYSSTGILVRAATDEGYYSLRNILLNCSNMVKTNLK